MAGTAALGTLTLDEPDYGASVRAVPMQSGGEVKYIRITDFDEDGIPPNHEFVTAEIIDEKYTLRDGDVLFARSGATAGKTFIYTPDIGPAIFAGYCIRFRFDLKRTLPWFVYFYTKTGRYRAWVHSIQRPPGQPNINKEEFKSFTIPLLSLTKQQQLVEEMKAARTIRQAKLDQADALLAGLDGFLLEQLGLILPEARPRLTYAIRRSDLNSDRLDSYFYTPFLRNTEQSLHRSVVKIVKLASQLKKPPINGVDARNYLETGQRYLRVQNVKPFELSLDDVKYVVTDSVKSVTLEEGNILLTRKGTFGVAARVPKEAEDCLISSEIILLRLSSDAECLPDYLVAWLNSSVAKILFDRYKAGGIMGHLTQEVVSDFPVPVLSLEAQQNIVVEVTRCREQARHLRAEAAKEWEAAKSRFEVRLLGKTQ